MGPDERVPELLPEAKQAADLDERFRLLERLKAFLIVRGLVKRRGKVRHVMLQRADVEAMVAIALEMRWDEFVVIAECMEMNQL